MNSGQKKTDLRDQINKPGKPKLTPDTNDVEFAGGENPKVIPSSGRIVSPDPGNVVEGQNSKSN